MPHQQLVRFKLNQLGQSLIEVVVLVGLALVIVTGLTIVTVNGLKNSQFSQNQAQATRLAQEAIDCIRSVRDKNLPMCIGGSGSTCTGGTRYYWYDRETPQFSNQVWSLSFLSPGTNFSLVFPAGNSSNCIGLQSTTAVGNNNCSSLPLATMTDSSLNAGPFAQTFSRTINFQDDTNLSPSTDFKRVNVTVYWSDISGSHCSQIVTILSHY